MKKLDGLHCYENNNLVVRYVNKDRTKLYFQGKRLPKKILSLYPWMHEMVRIYVKHGSVKATKFIYDTTGWGLRKSWNFLKDIRGKEQY
jgi:hypothetical protein